MTADQQRYDRRGVSASKEDVHAAIRNIDKGLYPRAFCKIIPDILGGDPAWCNIMHAMVRAPSHLWPTCTGAKRAICLYGAV